MPGRFPTTVHCSFPRTNNADIPVEGLSMGAVRRECGGGWHSQMQFTGAKENWRISANSNKKLLHRLDEERTSSITSRANYSLIQVTRLCYLVIKLPPPTATIGQKPEERCVSFVSKQIYVARNWWRWLLIETRAYRDSLKQKKIAGYRQTATKNSTNKTSPSIGRGAHLIHYLKDPLFPNPSHSVVLPRYKITTTDSNYWSKTGGEVPVSKRNLCREKLVEVVCDRNQSLPVQGNK
ncbi:hypothetical protein CEXT_258011 [Caerostris extrusa]|uniref:Uncharacterized protein n=1 Tax=Caerostris extrusa TaxID=172846 RepID=A0AAV4NM59_CAEEX|nr:hypothetical protein CEXT_258011 [Caerostris extrusa]